MLSYQVIILLGSIIGILVTIGVSFTKGFLSQMANDSSLDQDDIRIYGAAAISFVLYIVNLVISLAVKNSKTVGITSIIISIIILIAMGGFGIVGFVLLLAGGIVAITYKDESHPRYNSDTRQFIQGIEKEERWTFKKAMGIVVC